LIVEFNNYNKMNPSNNTNFCASEHQQYRQNTNFNI
jgi:hypothetical protein